MRHVLIGLVVCALAAGCDKPDKVYNKLPSDFDPDLVNGFANSNAYYTGTKGFIDETTERDPDVVTVEVCTDSEIAAKQVVMVNQPIVPMKGSGGLDMTGGDEWPGLTIEEAQDPDMLCQALYYGDGIAAWGDYYEVIAFWDMQTRKIDDILVRSGYKGIITAGDFEFEINEAIREGGVDLSRGDGSSRDPRTEDNMRQMDRALITEFRPGLDASGIDCVEAGSCYIIMSGTLPVLVFMSVSLYVVLEPMQQHIVQIETALKRPFRLAMGEANVSGVTPTITGTSGAGIPDCTITYDTDWADIQSDCLADDTMAMAQVTAVYGYELVLAQMGGVLLYFSRSDLDVDEILPVEPTLQPGDLVRNLSINAGYEGNFSMPYSEVLGYFKTSLDAAIRDQIGLDTAEPSGVEELRVPGDASLPTAVDAAYQDRLRPGGIYAAYCIDDGPDPDTTYDRCDEHSSGRLTVPLINTLQGKVSSALGDRVTDKLSDPSFYVQHFEKAMGQYFNSGTALTDDQINFSPSASRPDTIYAIMIISAGGENYTVSMYYGGNDDRIHFINFQRGTTRMEDVLYRDAELPTHTDPGRDSFTFSHLLTSQRLGLSEDHPAIDTVTVIREVPETRRALLEIRMGSAETVQVLAPYLSASTISGYWLPITGPHSEFHPADWFSLYGGTIGAGFYLTPTGPDTESKEITALTGSGFFGTVGFCAGYDVRIGDYADELLAVIEEAGYPCEMIVRLSENREFITSMTDMDNQISLFVTNNMIDQVFAWKR